MIIIITNTGPHYQNGPGGTNQNHQLHVPSPRPWLADGRKIRVDGQTVFFFLWRRRRGKVPAGEDSIGVCAHGSHGVHPDLEVTVIRSLPLPRL